MCKTKKVNISNRSPFSFFTKIVLSLSIALSPMSAYSVDRNDPSASSLTPENVSRDAENKIVELKETVFDKEGHHNAELDPFMMLRQQVVDERPSHIKALKEEEAINDYEERVDYFTRKIKQLTDLKNKLTNRMSLEEQRGTATPEATQRAEQNLKELEFEINMAQVELDDLQDKDPRTGNGFELQSFIDTELSVRHYYGRRLQLVALDQDGYERATLDQRQFQESISPAFNAGNFLEGSNEDIQSFELRKPNGETLHHFDVRLAGALYFGPYIVFIEKSDDYQNQKLHFIDLRYSRVNIGNAPLPVFSMPLKIDQPIERFQITEGELEINDSRFHINQLIFLSQIQQVLFNLSVSMIDGSTYENATDLVGEIYEFHQKAIDAQGASFQTNLEQSFRLADHLNSEDERLKQPLDAKERDPLSQVVQTVLQESQMQNTSVSKVINLIEMDEVKDQEGKPLSESIRNLSDANKERFELFKANSGLSNYNKASARLRLLWEFLKRPRPEGSAKIQNALLILATSKSEHKKRVWDTTKQGVRSFVKSIWSSKIMRYGTYAAGAVVAANYLAGENTNFIYETVDMMSAAHQHYIGYMEHIDYGKHYLELSKDAFLTSYDGVFNIVNTYKAYLSEGKWFKFTYGLSSMLLTWVVLPIFSLHILVNAVYGFRKVKKIYKNGHGRAKTLIESLHQAAREDKSEYDRIRADSEKKVSGSDVSQMTPEDEALLTDYITDLDEQKRANRNILFKGLSKGFKTTSQGFKKVVDYSKNILSTPKTKDTDASTAAALKQLLISSASLRTLIRYLIIQWNYIYVPRISLLKPTRWLLTAAYPNFHGAAFKTDRQFTLPSTYNDGLDNWGKKFKTFLSKTRVARTPYLNSLMVSKNALRHLKKYESVLAKVEDRGIAFASKKAQLALIKKIKDPARLAAIFDTREGASSGVSSLYDKKLTKTLTKKERTFFRFYLTHLYSDVLEIYFKELLKEDDLNFDASNSERFGQRLRSEVRRGNIQIPTLNKAEYDEAFERAKAQLDMDDIERRAERDTNSLASAPKRADLNFRHGRLQSINPNNFLLKRTMVVEKMKDDARAIERTTRAVFTDLKTSVPISIFSILLLYSSVQTGLLMPFDPNGLETDTHTNYFSNQLFYGSLLPGLVYGFLGTPWLKIQMDSRVEQMAGFDQTVLFKDSQKGFWRFFFKNFFKNPKNKWAANQLHNLKIVLANFLPALPTLLAFQWIGLGRIDPGQLMDSYLVMSTTMFVGLGLKLDQAFELSQSWVSSLIPRKFRAHPKAQDFIQKRMNNERFKFTIGENLYDISLQENVAGSMFSFKDNVKVGTRAFLRLVFGGATPTIILHNAIEKVGSMGDYVLEGSSKVTESIDRIFTHKFEAWERFPERLTRLAPEGIERVTENPRLPTNVAGEFLGKAFGAVTTLGGFALAPYAMTFTYHKFKEKFLLRRGKSVKPVIEQSKKIKALEQELNDRDTADNTEGDRAATEDSMHEDASGLTCPRLLKATR